MRMHDYQHLTIINTTSPDMVTIFARTTGDFLIPRWDITDRDLAMLARLKGDSTEQCPECGSLLGYLLNGGQS